MKDEAFKSIQDPPKEENKPQQELEKRIFYLKTLYDLSQEIGFLKGTQEITKNLLLMMIGNFGAACGFISLFDVSQRKTDAFSQRGLGKDSLDKLFQEIESGRWVGLSGIAEVQAIDECRQPQAKENLFDLFSSLNLKIWIPFNIDATLKGGIGLGDKLSGEPYTPDDQELLLTMANQGAVAIENARLDQARIEALEQSKKELEQLNRAKGKALDHLSHELRTPLAVIQGNIRLLKRKTQAQIPPLVRPEFFDSLEKNLSRLSDIQQETDQIIRSHEELEMRPRPEKLDQAHSSAPETIAVQGFTEQILEDVKKKASHRNIQFQMDGEKDVRLVINPKVLEESLVGLVKNAVENTPDEGMIRILLEKKGQWVQLKVMDFGVGVTKANQKHLFNGLFHTLDTELYTSKKPYDFGAGGKGLDLLRIKTYGQRFGFDISSASQRCTYLPTERDLCPGKISECPHCRVREDCLHSGGSTFCLTFSLKE